LDDLGHALHLGAFGDIGAEPLNAGPGLDLQRTLAPGAEAAPGFGAGAKAHKSDGDALLQALLDAAPGLPARRLRLVGTAIATSIRARVHGQERQLAQLGAPVFDAVLRALRRRRRAAAGLRFEQLPLAGGGRLLSIEIDATAAGGSLQDLGFQDADADACARALRLPQGLILVAGPADSGRSSTLRALLDGVDAGSRHVQVHAPGVAGFAAERLCRTAVRRGGPEQVLLRLLRHDPDVLLFDAALSAPCARLLLQAATRGCLVLAALPAERAHHAFLHFRALGIAPRELAAVLAFVIAQRLARTLCPSCAEPDASEAVRRATAQAANSWLAGLPLRPSRARQGGCAACSGRGWSGRHLLYEVLEVDGGVRAMAEDDAVGVEMEQLLLAGGRGLWDHGLRRLAEGRLSLEGLRAAVRDPA
jgi:type II secretory ATPase GspE/PulE/Tfp pilus assembly ATPase PilB-like protein